MPTTGATNTLNLYDPLFYANEALIELEKALGLANRVFRGYDDSSSGRTMGSTINIRVPAQFTAQDAPSAPQDLTTGDVAIVLDQWKEVKFSLTDQELSYTGERIISEHIRPAAYALADHIDQALAGLVVDVPWLVDGSDPAVVADITALRRVMFDNKAVKATDMHFMMSGQTEEEFLNLEAFTQNQGAGAIGVESQVDGTLGTRYGYQFWANQNAQSLTSPTFTDLAGTAVGVHAIGATSLSVTAMEASGEVKKGDIVAIAGHVQQYVVTADVTLSTGAGILPIYGSPNIQNGGLEAALAGGEVVTLTLNADSAQTVTNSLGFHRDAFALAMAQLPTVGAQVFGARIASVTDPLTNLSIRSRMYYDGDNSRVRVSLDVLYGVKTLDGNKACRFRDHQ